MGQSLSISLSENYERVTVSHSARTFFCIQEMESKKKKAVS